MAIVGPTGAGKTTLLSLLSRFYDPQRGRDPDRRRSTSASSRSTRCATQISVVLQEPLLFAGTVAENIRYGRLDASTDEVIAAARRRTRTTSSAACRTATRRCSASAARLSGGERQRISVARAFLKDAPILVLDEPTSSIDSKTEEVILDALERLTVGRTTFMIAHRLSTIREADLIVVLDHGLIVERGTDEELLRKGGLYSQLQRRAGAASGGAAACIAAGRRHERGSRDRGCSG